MLQDGGGLQDFTNGDGAKEGGCLIRERDWIFLQTLWYCRTKNTICDEFTEHPPVFFQSLFSLVGQNFAMN